MKRLPEPISADVPPKARLRSRRCSETLAWIFVLVSGLSLANANAAVSGEPLVQRYSTVRVGAQPRFFAAAHDAEGVLYFGNAEGVVRFNGDEWTLLRLPGEAAATAMVTDVDGRVWVGGYDTLGWIRSRADGEMEFVDRRPRVPGGNEPEPLGNVWQLRADAETVIVRAEFAAYRIAAGARVERKVALDDKVRMVFPRAGALYARFDGRGLVQIKDDASTITLPGGGEFADQGVVALLGQAKRQLVVAERGFYVSTSHGVRWLATIGEAQTTGRPNVAITLGNDAVAVGTDRGYLLQYDADLNLRQSIHMMDGAIEALHIDREGGLWVVGEGDLARLRLPAHWTHVGRSQGLRGLAYATEWYDGALWVAGTAGLMRLPERRGRVGKAEHKNWFDYEGYALLATDAGMLVAYRTGLFVLGKDQRREAPLVEDEAVLWLAPVGDRRDRVLAVSESAVRLLSLRANKWGVTSTTELGERSPSSIQVRADGELWFIDTRSGVQRWRYDLESGQAVEQVAVASPEPLSPAELGSQSLFQLDGAMFLATPKGVYRYDDANSVFVDYVGPPMSLLQRPIEMEVLKTPAGTFALTRREMLRRAPNAESWTRVRFDDGGMIGFAGIDLDSDGALRVITWDGILQYESDETRGNDAPLQVGLAKIGERHRDGSYAALAAKGDDRVPTLAAGASLEVRFALVTVEPGVQFRYRLHGVREEWSQWTDDRDLRWQTPRAGEFSLEVQARTPSGREATPLFYRFRVEPLWRDTAIAKALLVTIILLLIFGLVQAVAWWRTQRFRAANARLERRIVERTEELEVANRKLAELATVDSLTGVSNRRTLDAGLAREWHRCLDQRRPIAALMIDVDHFKRFNDQRGHLEGDCVLRDVAHLLRDIHDPNRELLARFGGEEFVLVLPGMHLDDARLRAEGICAGVRESDVPVTVSIGVAAQVPSPLDDPSMLLRRADAALYRAKRNGRDRVEVAND